jgi:hypothetical protein
MQSRQAWWLYGPGLKTKIIDTWPDKNQTLFQIVIKTLRQFRSENYLCWLPVFKIKFKNHAHYLTNILYGLLPVFVDKFKHHGSKP